MTRSYQCVLAGLLLFLCAAMSGVGAISGQPAASFASAPQLAEARSGACAVMLPNGRVLVTGGEGSYGALASAEFIGTGWTGMAPPMNFARSGHVCAALSDGTVLAAGGRTNGGETNAAEVFDPAENAWRIVAPMGAARHGATASVLRDGRVLIAGGEAPGAALATLEIYDPAAGRFDPVVGVLSSPRRHHAAAVLHGGSVLIAGGDDGEAALASVDIFDPGTGKVEALGRMTAARAGLSATTLLDGRIFLAGGSDGRQELASTEIFDPATGGFAPAAQMDIPRRDHAALRIPDNNTILIVGGTYAGEPLAAAGLYVPWWDAYRPHGALPVGRYAAAAATVGENGLFVLAGGATRTAATGAVDAAAEPTILTDKNDYAPGEWVTISGANWTGSGPVSLVVRTLPERTLRWEGTAMPGADGNVLAVNAFQMQGSDVYKTFELTATQGELTAQVWTFTDGQDVVIDIGSQTPSPVLAGSSATYSVSVTRDNAANDFSVTLSLVIDLPGTTASFSPAVLEFPKQTPGTTLTSTLTISTPAAAPGGGTLFVVRAASGNHQVGEREGTLLVQPADATPPEVTVTFPDPGGTAGWFKTSPAVGSVTVSDPSNVTAIACTGAVLGTITGLGTAEAGASLTVTAEGINNVSCTATDGAGNTGAKAGSANTATVKIDTQRPDTSITAQPADPSNSTSAAFSFAGTDPSPASGVAGYECALDGGAFAPCTSPRNYTGLSDGSHTFQVRAIDAAGNPDATPASYTWTVDATPPEVTVTFPAPNGNAGWFKTSPVVGSVTVTDPSNVTAILCTGAVLGAISGAGTSTATAPLTVSAEGVNNVSCTATDGAGNTGAKAGSANTATVKIDTQPPDTSITDQPAALSNSTSAAFSFTGSDPSPGSGVAGYECVLDGGAFAPCTSPRNYTGLSDGSHTFQVRATDTAGNPDATPASYTWTVDATPPEVTVTFPSPDGNAGWFKTSPVVGSVTVTDPSNVTAILCTGAALGPITGAGTSTATASLTVSAEGVNNISCTATDGAGNTGAKAGSANTAAVKIDTQPPDTSITDQPAALSNSTSAAFSFTGSDPPPGSGVAGYECALDGGAFAPCTSPRNYTGLSDGSHTFQVRATDAAGNPDATPASYTWTVDATPPEVTVTFPSPDGNAGWFKSSPVVGSVTVTDPSNVTAILCAGAALGPITGAGTSTATASLTVSAEGVNNISCTATDGAGNTGAKAGSANTATVRIDTQPPVLTAASAPYVPGTWTNQNVTVTFACADSTSGVASFTPPVVVSSEGANQFVPGACTDIAGNGAAVTYAPIHIDKTPPTVTDIGPGVVAVNSPVQVTATITDQTGLSGVAGAQYRLDSGEWQDMSGAFNAETAAATAEIAPITAAGVHQVCVRGADVATNTSEPACILLAVYDPEGGFVTGGGWIQSPEGAYAPDPSLTGKANFGFVSKYQKGATVPTGNTEFHFQAGRLNFKSSSYEWLVIAGARAQYKGSGTINGEGGFGFMLTAIDGEVNGGGGVDKFRIKIWDQSSGDQIVYDNQMGAGVDAEPSTAIGGGSIVIHADNKGGKK